MPPEVNDLLEFLDLVIADQLRTGKIDDRTWQRFGRLDVRVRRAVHEVAAFLGRSVKLPPVGEAVTPADVSLLARRRAATAALLKFSVHTDAPAWSSALLEGLVVAQLSVPEGEVGDIFGAAFDLWEQHDPALSTPMANFVRALTVCCLTRHRSSFLRCDIAELIERVRVQPTTVAAYLLTFVVSAELSAAARTVVLPVLAGSARYEHAVRMLADD